MKIAGLVNFALLCFVLFQCVLFLYPEFVTRYWNLPNLIGVYVARVPIEELLFAATGGAVWSAA